MGCSTSSMQPEYQRQGLSLQLESAFKQLLQAPYQLVYIILLVSQLMTPPLIRRAYMHP